MERPDTWFPILAVLVFLAIAVPPVAAATNDQAAALAALDEQAASAAQVLGTDHPSVVELTVRRAAAWHAMAARFRRDENWRQAVVCLKKSLGLWRSVVGPDDAAVIMILTDLGEILVAARRTDRARAAFARAVTLTKRTFGTTRHPLARRARRGLQALNVATPATASAD